jgi:cephalosporin hydroxylase
LKFIVDTDQWTIQPADQSDGAASSWFDESAFDLLSQWWLKASWQRRYSYQFEWLGRPIIQLPTDMVMMQDLIYRLRPTVIIETGIAHGGSMIFHASLLSILHGKSAHQPCVIGIDIEIRQPNRHALEAHPLRSHIRLIEGSSIDRNIVEQAAKTLSTDDKVMIVLDSNHTRDHVLAELELYAPLVSEKSAIIVMDTIMPALADLPNGKVEWNLDHPATAINVFLQTDEGRHFCIDNRYDAIRLTHSPGGILLRQSVERDANG